MSNDTSIQVVYAATEAPMMQWFVGEVVSESEERVPIGYPLSGNELAVVDEDGELTPDGEVGELLVQSPYVALGTWSQGRCQAAGGQTDEGDGSVRIFRTGDLVRRRPDGLYDRLGRKDRQVKIRGARVELDGVETAIRRHPSVRDVGVVVRIDSESGRARLVAYVQPDEAASDRFHSRVGSHDASGRALLPCGHGVTIWRRSFLACLTQKLDTHGLVALDAQKCRAEADARPADADTSLTGTDAIEMAVARVWRDTLGLQLTRPEDDFFDLGGDSLRAITMTFELEKALGRELPTNLISQAPHIRGLLRKTEGERTGCLLPARRPQAGTGHNRYSLSTA